MLSFFAAKKPRTQQMRGSDFNFAWASSSGRVAVGHREETWQLLSYKSLVVEPPGVL
jgi:hypothetical protein